MLRPHPTPSVAAMARSPRLLLALLAPVLALSACGVDAGSEGDALVAESSVDETTSTTAADAGEDPAEETPDDTVPEGADEAVQTLIDLYTEMGFEPDEAECLAQEIASDPSLDPHDTSALMDIMNQCDIPMSRLMDIGGEMGDDPEAVMQQSLAAGFRAAGLTDEQADCAAAAFVDEFGTDPSSAGDPTVLQSLFAQCGVDPNQIGG